MEITTEFKEQVQKAWGNLYDVGCVAIDELAGHGVDPEDMTDYALKIGILVRDTKKEGFAIFTKRFKKEILIPMKKARATKL